MMASRENDFIKEWIFKDYNSFHLVYFLVYSGIYSIKKINDISLCSSVQSSLELLPKAIIWKLIILS